MGIFYQVVTVDTYEDASPPGSGYGHVGGRPEQDPDQDDHRRRSDASAPLGAAHRYPQRRPQPHRGRFRYRLAYRHRAYRHRAAQGRRRRGAVLRGLRGGGVRERQPVGQPDAADDRHRPARHHRPLSQRFHAGDQRQGHRGGAPARQDRRADGDRGRPRHRRQPAAAARLLRPGRALHDAHALQHQRLGGFLRRHRRPQGQASQRPDRFRQAGGSRDESPGHDGGHLARRRQDLLGRAGGQQGADLRVAFVVPGADQTRAQHDR